METQKLKITDWTKTGKLIFLVVSAAFTSGLLLLYSFLLTPLIPSSNMYREFAICFGQIVFQSALILCFYRKFILLDYLYEMMMVSFIGGALLTPAIVSSLIFFPLKLSPFYFLLYFSVIVLFMFAQHKKKVKELNAPHWLTYTWVLYRLLVLFFVL